MRSCYSIFIDYTTLAPEAKHKAMEKEGIIILSEAKHKATQRKEIKIFLPNNNQIMLYYSDATEKNKKTFLLLKIITKKK